MRRGPNKAWSAERWTRELENERYLAEHAVYFIQYGAGGLVKIGVTRDIDKRMTEIQSFCPLPIRLLGWDLGGHHEETRLHKLFNDSRAWGEWFRPTEDIIRYVAENTTIAGRPPAPRKPDHKLTAYERRSRALELIKTP